MFRKKTEVKQEVKSTEALRFHSISEILAAVEIIKDAAKSGQIPCKWFRDHSEGSSFHVLVVSELSSSSTIQTIVHNLGYHNSAISVVDKDSIKDMETMIEERRKAKESQLKTLRDKQAELNDSVEKLARELGEKGE